MLINTGVPTKDDLKSTVPTPERLARGAVAVVECFQEIPCNPCVKACNRGAISMPRDINDLPVVDVELCNGCGICISFCPGLAIFVIDTTYSEEFALVKIPYEYVPVPLVGEFVAGLDREGNKLGLFKVVRVTSGGIMNMTYTVSLAVPHELVLEVRGVGRRG